MSKPRKPKRHEFPDLLEAAAAKIDNVIPALNAALDHAKANNHSHGKVILNRLIIHAMAIAKGARQLAGLDQSQQAPPQPPAASTPTPVDLNQKESTTSPKLDQDNDTT